MSQFLFYFNQSPRHGSFFLVISTKIMLTLRMINVLWEILTIFNNNNDNNNLAEWHRCVAIRKLGLIPILDALLVAI